MINISNPIWYPFSKTTEYWLIINDTIGAITAIIHTYLSLICDFVKIPNAKFTIKGMLDYNGDLKVFNVNAYYREYNNSYSYSINIDKHVQGMNIDLFGSKFISLYTFDMLNNRTKGKIRYSNITIIK